jgi:osmoprotectant transport system permease protein
MMANVFGWLFDPTNWSGSTGIPDRVLQHLQLSFSGVALALLVAIPVGMAIGHTRRAEFLVVSVANLGRAIPSFAILTVVYQFMLNYKATASLAFGYWPTVVALFLLAIPPILTNTYVGIQTVDLDTVEAARGMGLTGRQILFRLETPLAMPLIVAGTRTAAVQVVATATLSALIGGGGLGRFIIDGFSQGNDAMAAGGAVLVAVLAILTELTFGLLNRVVRPRTSSARRGPAPEPALDVEAAA